MKKLLVEGYEYTAETVYKTVNSITGYTGNTEVFKFAGISDFSMYKLEDEEGNPAEYDISEEDKAQNTIDSLVSQLFEAQTKLLQSENDKVTLGQQLFNLQTQLITKGVL